MKFPSIKASNARNLSAAPERLLRESAPHSSGSVSAGTRAVVPARAEHPPLDEYYNSLFTAFGPQHWWPGKTQFEVIVGAILTQNTSWRNVERAIENLRRENLLSPLEIEKT